MMTRLRHVCGWLALALIVEAAVGVHPESAASAPLVSKSECPVGIEGAWTSSVTLSRLFPVEISLEETDRQWTATFTWPQGSASATGWQMDERVRFQAAQLPISVEIRPSGPSIPMDGFVAHGRLMTQLRWSPSGTGWTARWSPVVVDPAGSRLDLYIDPDGGYFFFRDPRLPSLYGMGVFCDDGRIRIEEGNLGLTFTGTFDHSADRLDMTVDAATGVLPVSFRRMAPDEVPSDPTSPDTPAVTPERLEAGIGVPAMIDDDWETADPIVEHFDRQTLVDLVHAVAGGRYPNTHAIVVARNGRLVFEEYFHGFDRTMPHDTRSAAKSFASLFVGAAIDEGLIDSVGTTALSYFPDYHAYANWDERKARITLRDLLRMASGLDADDSNRNSSGSEAAYQSQRANPDWVKLVLDTPMIDDPGAQSLYGGGNPLILGGVLHSAVGEPLEWFAHRSVFAPLGIHGYSFVMAPDGIPYLGGGYHVTPRHLAALGQLVLDRGEWDDHRVLDAGWIDEATTGHGRLAPLNANGHQYGYLWWRHVYRVGDREIETIEARGNGGQYLFVVPELDLVTVINSGNYRGGLEATRQPERIFGAFILPAAMGR